MKIMSSLIVVVKSQLFPQFFRLNRAGVSSSGRGDGEFEAVNRGWADTISGSCIHVHGHGAAAVGIRTQGGDSTVTHNSDSQ